MSDEQRADDGVRLRKFIDVVVEEKTSFTLFRGAVTDISESGMRVLCDQYLPKGTHYTFTFKRAPMLTVRGEIRWVRAFDRETFACGIRFVDLTDSDRSKLHSFLEIERRRVPTS